MGSIRHLAQADSTLAAFAVETSIFSHVPQYQLWLGEKYDRDYVSKVVLEQTGDEGEEPDAPHQGDQRW